MNNKKNDIQDTPAFILSNAQTPAQEAAALNAPPGPLAALVESARAAPWRKRMLDAGEDISGGGWTLAAQHHPDGYRILITGFDLRLHATLEEAKAAAIELASDSAANCKPGGVDGITKKPEET